MHSLFKSALEAARSVSSQLDKTFEEAVRDTGESRPPVSDSACSSRRRLQSNSPGTSQADLHRRGPGAASLSPGDPRHGLFDLDTRSGAEGRSRAARRPGLASAAEATRGADAEAKRVYTSEAGGASGAGFGLATGSFGADLSSEDLRARARELGGNALEGVARFWGRMREDAAAAAQAAASQLGAGTDAALEEEAEKRREEIRRQRRRERLLLEERQRQREHAAGPSRRSHPESGEEGARRQEARRNEVHLLKEDEASKPAASEGDEARKGQRGDSWTSLGHKQREEGPSKEQNALLPHPGRAAPQPQPPPPPPPPRDLLCAESAHAAHADGTPLERRHRRNSGVSRTDGETPAPSVRLGHPLGLVPASGPCVRSSDVCGDLGEDLLAFPRPAPRENEDHLLSPVKGTPDNDLFSATGSPSHPLPSAGRPPRSTTSTSLAPSTGDPFVDLSSVPAPPLVTSKGDSCHSPSLSALRDVFSSPAPLDNPSESLASAVLETGKAPEALQEVPETLEAVRCSSDLRGHASRIACTQERPPDSAALHALHAEADRNGSAAPDSGAGALERRTLQAGEVSGSLAPEESSRNEDFLEVLHEEATSEETQAARLRLQAKVARRHSSDVEEMAAASSPSEAAKTNSEVALQGASGGEKAVLLDGAGHVKTTSGDLAGVSLDGGSLPLCHRSRSVSEGSKGEAGDCVGGEESAFDEPASLAPAVDGAKDKAPSETDACAGGRSSATDLPGEEAEFGGLGLAERRKETQFAVEDGGRLGGLAFQQETRFPLLRDFESDCETRAPPNQEKAVRETRGEGRDSEGLCVAAARRERSHAEGEGAVEASVAEEAAAGVDRERNFGESLDHLCGEKSPFENSFDACEGRTASTAQESTRDGRGSRFRLEEREPAGAGSIREKRFAGSPAIEEKDADEKERDRERSGALAVSLLDSAPCCASRTGGEAPPHHAFARFSPPASSSPFSGPRESPMTATTGRELAQEQKEEKTPSSPATERACPLEGLVEEPPLAPPSPVDLMSAEHPTPVDADSSRAQGPGEGTLATALGSSGDSSWEGRYRRLEARMHAREEELEEKLRLRELQLHEKATQLAAFVEGQAEMEQRASVEQQLRQQIEDLEQQTESLLQTVDAVNSEAREQRQLAQAAQAEKDEMEQEAHRLSRRMAQLEQSNKRLRADLQTIRSERDSLLTNNEALSKKTSRLQTQASRMNEAETQLEELREENGSLQQQLQAAQSERQSLQNDLEGVHCQLREAQLREEEILKKHAEALEKSRSNSELLSVNSQLQSQLEERSTQLLESEKRSEEKEAELQSEIAELKKKVEELETELATSTSPLLSRLAAAEQQAACAREEGARLSVEIRKRMEAEIEEIRGRAAEEKRLLSNEIDRKHAEASELRKQLETLKLEESVKAPTDAAADEREIQALRATRADLEEQLRHTRSLLKSKDMQIDALRKAVEELREEIRKEECVASTGSPRLERAEEKKQEEKRPGRGGTGGAGDREPERARGELLETPHPRGDSQSHPGPAHAVSETGVGDVCESQDAGERQGSEELRESQKPRETTEAPSSTAFASSPSALPSTFCSQTLAALQSHTFGKQAIRQVAALQAELSVTMEQRNAFEAQCERLMQEKDALNARIEELQWKRGGPGTEEEKLEAAAELIGELQDELEEQQEVVRMYKEQAEEYARTIAELLSQIEERKTSTER
ncbi:hypothetical protein TGDOM2_258080 [Toxoplasma gondii GAB2-2007-GAL-DOM2]|uniref:Uncharacterized protein n=5 Tax=Toxoplasma gondii TaxID=5811 RepID=A0A3R7YQS7_TOXGO|nr:hypothetical protein TGDOM2_258080 [Toxoplasma gondii GAB2-2007-GAL-DOM2]RQX71097.1 hypothetical protein TGCAST_258080 [Toxoplasma gondii CAST]